METLPVSNQPKPAASPNAAPKPSPAPAPKSAAPSPAPEKKPDPAPIEEDFVSDLEKLGSDPDEQKSEAPPDPEAPEVPEIDVEKPEKPPVAPEKGSDEPKSAGELRKAYNTVKTERDTLKKQIEDMGKRTAKDDPETKAIIESATKANARLQELESEIKHLKYERSSEYKDRFEKPIEKAFNSAISEVKQMTVSTDEGDRAATTDDFNAILRAPTQQAATMAKNMFGDAAAEVLAHRREILKLNQQRQDAIEEYRTKGAESEKEQTAKHATESQRLRVVWEQESKGVLEKYPQFFGPEEGDDEGNKFLEDGFKLADLAFLGTDRLPPEKLLQIRADVRARAAGFGRAVIKSKRLEAKVAALEKELQQYKASEPGTGGNPGTKETIPADEDYEAGLMKLASQQ